MELPNALRLGIERALRDLPAQALEQAAGALSAQYRVGHSRGDAPPLRDAIAAAAYAATRMPATYAAIRAALAALALAQPAFLPQSLLDVGAGTGAALWAAAETWETLGRSTLVERAAPMISLGRRLAEAAAHPAVSGAAWRSGDLGAVWSAEAHDLTTAAYLLGELGEPARDELVDRLWAATGHAMVLVEPGTPLGFAIIRAQRDRLRAAGAWIAAPCPHQGVCPMPAGDWCHFAQRIARTRAHRQAKGATLSYEDEKFAYVALTRTPIPARWGRVLRHPLTNPGRIEIQLCTPAGLSRETITRSAGPRWRLARDLHWGDTLPDSDVVGPA